MVRTTVLGKIDRILGSRPAIAHLSLVIAVEFRVNGGTTTECRSFEARIEVDLREFDDAKRRKRLGRGSKAPTCDRTGGLEFQSRGDGGEASFESAPSHGAVAARPPLLSRAPN